MTNNQQKMASNGKFAIEARNLSVFYGDFQAIKDVNLEIKRQKITAIIGPSGCGKSTMLRSFNRMNELVPQHGQKVKCYSTVIISIRMMLILCKSGGILVWSSKNQTHFPKPFMKMLPGAHELTDSKAIWMIWLNSLCDKLHLWDEVKDKLDQSGFSLSGGQQQRLCIARTIAVRPEIILMDEPASALDPIATLKIEDLMRELAENYTIIVVTHNMQQAARVSDFTAFFMMDEDRSGYLVEHGPTKNVFTKPKDPRTEDYITGRFG